MVEKTFNKGDLVQAVTGIRGRITEINDSARWPYVVAYTRTDGLPGEHLFRADELEPLSLEDVRPEDATGALAYINTEIEAAEQKLASLKSMRNIIESTQVLWYT